MFAIETVDLSKYYKNIAAADAVNLKIKHGELFALLGVNGAGKTTVIKMLSCLTHPSSGEGYIYGYNIKTQIREVKKSIGVSPQETAIAPNLTVRENLQLICGIYGFGKDKTNVKITELCQQLGLNDILHRKAGKLSGGWQRRLSIAMALICDPKILFLDEPTLGLDVIARQELWNVINALKGNVTIILTTHYLKEAQALSDRIGIMKEGRVLATGTSDELIRITDSKDLETAFISIVREVE